MISEISKLSDTELTSNIKDNIEVSGCLEELQNRHSGIFHQKARKFQPKKISNSVAASDAFFPFSDGLKLLVKAGVKIVIQPGGSIRDKEIIEYANKANIKMLFAGTRHFYH